MICDLITDQSYLEDVVCADWEELVEIGGGLLVKQGSVEPRFIQSIKDTIAEFGAYMVLVDDIAFFHGRPEAGVKETSMSLASYGIRSICRKSASRPRSPLPQSIRAVIWN